MSQDPNHHRDLTEKLAGDTRIHHTYTSRNRLNSALGCYRIFDFLYNFCQHPIAPIKKCVLVLLARHTTGATYTLQQHREQIDKMPTTKIGRRGYSRSPQNIKANDLSGDHVSLLAVAGCDKLQQVECEQTEYKSRSVNIWFGKI